jgi:hypothetical protein
MATKTFKIGEYCVGGIITAEVSKTKITIINKDWDFSTGSRKSSDQSNAKELQRSSFDVNKSSYDEYAVERYLNVLTSSYYAGEVIKWINTKLK